MNIVTLIGNNASGNCVSDGGRIKLRLYTKLLRKSGFSVQIVDLDGWVKRILKIILNIKKALSMSDSLIIMAGPKGCRLIIPLVTFLNKKTKCRIIFCPLGIGTIDKKVKKLTHEKLSDFIECRDFFSIHDKRMGKYLSKLDAIIPQNEQLVTLYKRFYKLNNVQLINNFRDCEIIPKKKFYTSGPFKIIYASRVCKEKGVFDLMYAVRDINKNASFKLSLTIFGDLQLNENEKKVFSNLLDENIVYKGIIPQDSMMNTMRQFDLFCLPTRYHGEGTSGALIESLICGTPVLVSSYSQVKSVINDGQNGFVFRLGDRDDLRNKVLSILKNTENLKRISVAGQDNAKKYVFKYNEKDFISVIKG